ncbi:hypothetical protein GCM10010465_08980 [Actinomadura fibrosa]
MFSQSFNAFSQIFEEKKDIIITFGSDYETGLDSNGNHYLAYNDTLWSDTSGKYNRTFLLYFTNIEDNLEVCSHMKVLEPASEKDNIITFYDREMEKLDAFYWKDPQTNYLYELEIIDPFSVLYIWFDDGKNHKKNPSK